MVSTRIQNPRTTFRCRASTTSRPTIPLYLGFTAYLISVLPKQYVVVAVVILGVGVTLGVKALQYLESAATRSDGPR